MKIKISLLLFLFLYNNSFSQDEKSFDSIIIAITANYCEFLPDPISKENASRGYSQYLLDSKKRTDSLSFLFSTILKENNLHKIDSMFFRKLRLIKNKNLVSASYDLFFIDLQAFSDSISKNNINNKLRILNQLKSKYIIQTPSVVTVNNSVKENEYVLFSIENIIICLLVIFILVMFFYYKNQMLIREKKIDEMTHDKINSNSLQDNYSINDHDKRKIFNLEEENSKLKQENASLILKNSEAIYRDEINNVTVENSELVHTNSKVQQKIFFSRQPNYDGNFRNDLRNDFFEASLSMFKFKIDKDYKNKASYEFCGDSVISNSVAYHPDNSISLVCDFENSRNNFSAKIDTTKTGVVELRDDIWIVTKKAVIKFS
jgi:hypothetical protein